MSLLGRVQAKPGKGVGRTVDTSSPKYFDNDDDDDAPRQHPAQVIDPSARLYSWEILPKTKKQTKKIQSRESKTACFVFCSFHCLKRNKDKPSIFSVFRNV